METSTSQGSWGSQKRFWTRNYIYDGTSEFLTKKGQCKTLDRDEETDWIFEILGEKTRGTQRLNKCQKSSSPTPVVFVISSFESKARKSKRDFMSVSSRICSLRKQIQRDFALSVVVEREASAALYFCKTSPVDFRRYNDGKRESLEAQSISWDVEVEIIETSIGDRPSHWLCAKCTECGNVWFVAHNIERTVDFL